MLTPFDYIVLVVYLVGVVGFGIKVAGKQTSTQDYFLGGKSMPWWAICFSIVATETSTLTVIGIPAVAYGGTMTFFQITFGYLLGRSVVSWILLPKYAAGEIKTPYQYLGTRFGAKSQSLASATFLVTRLLADGVRLFATAIPIRIIAVSAGFDIGYPVIILAIGVVTAVYTYIGGLRSVVWMDAVQMIIYLLGAVLTIGLLLQVLPDGFASSLSAAGKLTVFDGTGSIRELVTSPYTLVTAVIGGGIFSMASHGTDHLIVQRLLACRSLQDARKAIVGSALFVMVQFALFLIVGALLWSHYGGATPAELGLSRADEVFPKFILEGLPAGISGLVLAGILAAAMSTLSSSLNALASSSLFDLMGKRVSHLSDASQLRTSRIMTLVWAGVFVLFAVQFTSQQSPVVELGLSIASFTYGALLGAFLLGLWNQRASEGDLIPAFVLSIVVMTGVIFGVWETGDGSWIWYFRPDASIRASMGLTGIAWPWTTTLGTVITLGAGSLIALRHK